jgi:hypothetical protein
MNRRQRAALARIERQVTTEDPELDRLLRAGLPPAARRRRYRLAAALGTALALLSLAVGYPLGALLGAAALAIGVRQLWRTRSGIKLTHVDARRDPRHERGRN